MRELLAWYESFEEALEAVNEGSAEEAAARVIDVASDLDVLHARARNAQRLRPWHGYWASVDKALDMYEQIRDSYLAALTAPTPEAVAAEAARGQAAIDGATAAINRSAEIGDAHDRAGNADLRIDHGPTFVVAEAVSSLSGTASVLELERLGGEKFARIAGPEVVCPSGFGVMMELLDFVVEGLFDQERFWRAARRVYEVLAPHPNALRGLVQDAGWRREYVAVSNEIRDASFEAAAVAATGTENRGRLIQSALRLAGRQIERCVPPLLATVLAVIERRPYASERSRDFNALLTKAEQRGHADLLYGLDAKLRDADAHANYEITEDGVLLTGTRGKLESLTDDELVDVTIGAMESISALNCGIVAALASAVADTSSLDEAFVQEVTGEDRVKFVLLFNGWHDVEVNVSGEELVAEGSREGEETTTLIAAVAAVAPEPCDQLTLVLRRNGERSTARGRVAPLARMREAEDDVAKGIAHAVALAGWTINGIPIMSGAQIEKLYAYRAIEALNPAVDAGTGIRTLRLLLDAAHELELDALASAVGAAMRYRREIAAGMPTAADVETGVGAFDEWLLKEVPEIRQSW